MAKNKSLRKQKTYKMRGCSKKSKKMSKKMSRRIGFNSRRNLSGGATNPGTYPISQQPPLQNGLGFINPSGGQRGGNCGCGIPMTGGAGPLYPNGLVGSPINVSNNSLPGLNGIPGDRNYTGGNMYTVDPQTAINSSPLVGGKRRKKGKQRGGTTSNFLFQDLVNLGRQFQYGLGSAYNGISGYPAGPNPMPWKSQMTGLNSNSLAALKSNVLV
jgi:hypothetical protein